MQKLSSILIIDDDEVNNYVCSKLIKQGGLTDEVHTALNGLEGLDFLKKIINANKKLPDLIFLDINMPEMNGWAFLEEYKELKKSFDKKVVLIMLSSSVHSNDIEKASMYEDIQEYVTKPLISNSLKKIAKKYFG